MTMGVKAFVDTNILLRALMTELNLHPEAHALLKQLLHEDTELWISGQVIREFMVQVTHPKTLHIPLTIQAAIKAVERIKPVFSIADENAAVREQLLELLQNYPTAGKQIHDANIVATMLAYGIDTLLMLNVDDMKRFGDKISLVTLETAP
jgi:predicted nucleic acid-binding protein